MQRSTHILLALLGAAAFAACREPGTEANLVAATSAGAPTQVNTTFTQAVAPDHNDNPVGGPHEADADAVVTIRLLLGRREQLSKA